MIPDSIGNLKNLLVLYLSDNQLTSKSIPKKFWDLTTLEYLNITDNKLVELSEGIGNLINLKELRLYNNDIQTLPNSIGKMVI